MTARSAAIVTAPRGGASRVLETALRFQGYLGLLIVLCVGAIFSPVRNGVNLFVDLTNQMNVLRYVAETGIIAVGMTLVILVGEIDLSVGSVLALVATLTAHLLARAGFSSGPAVILALLTGAAVGFMNGIVVARLRIPSFVATLAMMTFARGLVRVIFGGVAIPLLPHELGGAAPDAVFFLAQRVGFVPVPALIMVIVAVVFGLLLRYTPFGRHVYAVGGNPLASRLSGVRVDLTKVVVFTALGVLTGLAALIHGIQLNQGAPNDGISYELNAIAAVVIGGTSLQGGIGTIAGSIAGAWMLGLIDNALNLNNINSDIQLLVKGALIVAAVALQRLQRRA
jgi:ribose transport system permease protein